MKNRYNFNKKSLLLAFLILGISASTLATPEVSRRSFLAMFGGALGAAAMGPKLTLLADKVLVTQTNEAQRLMQIRSSLDFDFLRRSAWERYFTGKVTVNPSGRLGNELANLQNYRAQLADFISNHSTSAEGRELAKVLYRQTNHYYPFDISPREYTEKAKEFFEGQRAKTFDLRTEETVAEFEDSFERAYREALADFENGEFERAVSISLCVQYLR